MARRLFFLINMVITSPVNAQDMCTHANEADPSGSIGNMRDSLAQASALLRGDDVFTYSLKRPRKVFNFLTITKNPYEFKA